MAEPSDEVTVPPESTSYAILHTFERNKGHTVSRMQDPTLVDGGFLTEEST